MTSPTPPDPNAYILTIKQVCELVDPQGPINRTTLWRWIRDGAFPKPTIIGKKRRWCFNDLNRAPSK